MQFDYHRLRSVFTAGFVPVSSAWDECLLYNIYNIFILYRLYSVEKAREKM